MAVLRRVVPAILVSLGLFLLRPLPMVAQDSPVRLPGRTVELKAADYDAFTLVPRRHLDEALQEAVPTATFEITYIDFSPEAEAAFQYAVDIWSTLVESSETIRIEATWKSLNPGTLGSAGNVSSWRNFLGARRDDTWYPDALADALANVDLGDGEFDIKARFNSDYTWYLGTDGLTPAGQHDFVTVVLHEIGHGLGFFGWMVVDNGTDDDECTGVEDEGCWGDLPGIYDHYTVNGADKPLLSFDNNSLALGEELVSGALYFSGSGAVEAFGGQPPPLYSPDPWDYGSSYSHLDEATFPAGDPNSLMTPALGRAEAIHDPGRVALCMFEDMGWKTSASCPGGDQGIQEVLTNQTSFCGGEAFPSQYFTDLGVGVDAADDFVVPDGEHWSMDSVVAVGRLDVVGDPEVTYAVTVFSDSSGVPGSAVCSYPALEAVSVKVGPSFAMGFGFELDSPCELDPGTYWLEVQAALGASEGTFFWTPSKTIVEDEYVWRDPSNLFAVSGCLTWTPHTQCGVFGGPEHDLCYGLGIGLIPAEGIFSDGFETGDLSAWTSSVP